jgi:branched-chain amino acid aminotransferase
VGPAGAVVFIDGAHAPDPRVSIFDRGFLFGDGVFEALRTYRGEPFALQEHIQRLSRSMALLAIPLTFGPDVLEAEVREVVRLARVGDGELYLRIMVTRGVGPLHLDPRPAIQPCRVVLAAPLLPLSATLATGVSMATVRAHRAADGTAAAASKVSAYVGNLLALMEAQARGAYEALLVTDDGAVLEGHSSSFFVVRDGRVETPPLAMGILPGITRALVEQVAGELSIPFVERVLTASDAYGADEAFLTSSLREVVPVTEIDGVRIAFGPITAALRDGYRRRVG